MINFFTDKQKHYFKLKHRPPLALGYIRVSPEIPNPEKHFERDKGYEIFAVLTETVSGMTSWQNRKKLKWLVDGLKSGDRLVVYGFSQLSRSTSDVITLLTLLHHRDVQIHDIKNEWNIDDLVSKKMLEMMQKISAQIDHEVISMRVTEGLAARRAKGLPLGRKKGAVVKSKLDAHKNEIISLIKAGSTKAYIIKKFDTSKTNLYHWLKRNDLDKITPIYNDKSNP